MDSLVRSGVMASRKPTKATPEPTPRKSRSGPSGPSLTEERRAERGIGRLVLRVAQKKLDKLEREAEKRGVSRSALIEELLDSL